MGHQNAAVLGIERRWECPNCVRTHVTRDPRPHTPFHQCGGLSGLVAPFVEAGTKCTVFAVVREDYVGKEDVRWAGGLPIMNVTTIRDDGQDCAVFAPTARMSTRGDEG